MLKWRKANKERIAAYKRTRGAQYYKDNKERILAEQAVKYAAKRKALEEQRLPLADLPGEIWLPVPFPGYEKHYMVSSLGRVKSLRKLVAWVHPKTGKQFVLHRAERVLRQKPGAGGYVRVTISAYGKEKSVFVHVLVLSAFKGPRPNGLVCCHNNGNSADNRFENLRWDTQSSNNGDRYRHGHYPVKYSEELVKQIMSGKVLLAEARTVYGVPRGYFYSLRKGVIRRSIRELC